MKTSTPSLFRGIVATILLLLAALTVHGAEAPHWAGEYSDKNFLNGRAVFQLSIEQSSGAMQVAFDAAWNDGHGAAPEAEGPAKVSGNTLTFKFEDSFKNTGTGTITRAGSDIIVSLNPTRVVDSRCLAFYGKNMRLKRVGK